MTSLLRVGSWNAREGLPEHCTTVAAQPDALAPLVALLAEYDVDVLALQEIDFDPVGRSAVLDALRDSPLGHVYAEPLSPSTYLPDHRAGLGIASRVPIVGHGLDLLPNPGLQIEANGQRMHSFEKGMIAGTVEFDGLRVTVASVHALPFRRFGRTPDEAEFAPIWQALADELGKFDGDPLVVCGDFNTPRRDLLLDVSDRVLARAIGDRPTHRGQSTDDILYSTELIPAAEPLVLPTCSDHELCLVYLAPS